MSKVVSRERECVREGVLVCGTHQLTEWSEREENENRENENRENE